MNYVLIAKNTVCPAAHIGNVHDRSTFIPAIQRAQSLLLKGSVLFSVLAPEAAHFLKVLMVEQNPTNNKVFVRFR